MRPVKPKQQPQQQQQQRSLMDGFSVLVIVKENEKYGLNRKIGCYAMLGTATHVFFRRIEKIG
jgi:hypothetical protein